jgi:hypothetical protein
MSQRAGMVAQQKRARGDAGEHHAAQQDGGGRRERQAECNIFPEGEKGSGRYEGAVISLGA